MTAPPGLEWLLASRGGRNFSHNQYKMSVLVLTFLSYMAYHATRKPPSVVKGALNPTDPNLPGWAPFNGPNGNVVLGNCDVAFLSSYAAGMFYSGHLGDSLDLRIFLTVGMLGSGLFTIMYGMGYFMDIHSVWYFMGVQIIAGLFQSTGWPSVVAVVARWFGKSKRGLIMGIWNAHTSIGNILGTLIGAGVLRFGWGYSFVVPGVMMIFIGVLLYLFLVISPEHAGLGTQEDESIQSKDDAPKKKVQSVGILKALQIPGVVPFSLCLFFSKLVAYTFLYWLPYYIKNTEIGGETLSTAKAGELSTLFDIGGVMGGVLAGYISDRFNARSITSAAFVYAAVPCLYLYYEYGYLSYGMNVILLILSGVCVNGPYALITTAVSADLGTHESLRGNANALATVTAIIDGTGSIGAALGPMLTGYLSQIGDGWSNVFYMLYIAEISGGLLLMRLVLKEAMVIGATDTDLASKDDQEMPMLNPSDPGASPGRSSAKGV